MSLEDVDKYLTDRRQLIAKEQKLFLGEQLELNEEESKLDKYLIKIKCQELDAAYIDNSCFLPKQHFFRAKKKIEKSKVFQFLKKIPKGCSLHTHLLAASSLDFIVKNITYDDYAYGKCKNKKFQIKFMKPEKAKKKNYISLKEVRKRDKNFDDWLKSQFSMVVDNPEQLYTCGKTAWNKFGGIFFDLMKLLSYKPAFEKFYYQCLKEHYEDNIISVEFRANDMRLYDLDGNIFGTEVFYQTMLDVEEKFKNDYENFVGVRYIHSVGRSVSTEYLKKEINMILEMKNKFPKLIAGLDFVGLEDDGPTLIDLKEILVTFQNDFQFFFHAGETNWFGTTDMNLFDAIIMKTRRIGHATALSRHPVLMDLVMEQHIAIELCPISNQVLCLCEDPRNHPIIPLLAKSFSVVICNDDPAIWEASGLSYDWYIAFMAMTPKNCGLKFLKQLALNSVYHSALGEDKGMALELWTQQWNKFVSEMVQKLPCLSDADGST